LEFKIFQDKSWTPARYCGEAQGIKMGIKEGIKRATEDFIRRFCHLITTRIAYNNGFITTGIAFKKGFSGFHTGT